MRTSIKSNINDVIKGLNNFDKKQLPYAISVTLNNTAEIAMKAMKQKIDSDFTVTSQSWNKVGGKFGIKKKRATKVNSTVEIFIPDANTWIEDHEEGNIRTGLQLIPTKEFKNQFPNLKTNRSIKKKAQNLLANKTKNRIFEAKVNNDDYIFQRKKGKVAGTRQLKSKKTGRLLKAKKILNRESVPLFLIKNMVKEKKRLDFYSTIQKVFTKNIDKEFNNALKYAISTAK